MSKVRTNVARTLYRMELARLYLKSKSASARMKESLSGIQTYCMFIGYPRSGHSLIGSLLDAHPDVVIAHEQDALEYIQASFSQDQIYYLLLQNSRVFTQAGRRWYSYSYQVPNQWQGRFRQLKVIGDKRGAGSVERLMAHPELLELMHRVIDVNVKYIHVTRNPYDMISTTNKIRNRPYWTSVRQRLILEALRGGHRRLLGALSSLEARHHRSVSHVNVGETGRETDLMDDIEYFVSLCQTVASIKRRMNGADIQDIRLESFIENPRSCLRELCLFLGIDPSEGYLDDCARVVHRSAHKSRHDVPWEDEMVDLVKENLIERYTLFEGYSYEL